MENCNLIFTFNISEKNDFVMTKYFVWKSTHIVRSPNVGSSRIKVLDIFYPIERQLQESPRGTSRSGIKEKIIGQVKLAISQSEQQINNNINIKKEGKAEIDKYQFF